jgi:hypothetical protein
LTPEEHGEQHALDKKKEESDKINQSMEDDIYIDKEYTKESRSD